MTELIKIILAVLFVTACSGSVSKPVERNTDIAALTVTKLETWPSFYKNQDADGLADFLHPDFVFILNDGGRSTYTDEVDWVRNNPWSGNANDDFIYKIEDIIFMSDNVAMIYGKGTSTRETESGQLCAHSYWSSNTLRRVDGRWRPTHSHVSGTKCDPF